MLLKEKTLILAFWKVTVLMVGLAIVGGLHSYSPVPVLNMWDGTLKKIKDVGQRWGEWSAIAIKN